MCIVQTTNQESLIGEIVATESKTLKRVLISTRERKRTVRSTPSQPVLEANSETRPSRPPVTASVQGTKSRSSLGQLKKKSSFPFPRAKGASFLAPLVVV